MTGSTTAKRREALVRRFQGLDGPAQKTKPPKSSSSSSSTSSTSSASAPRVLVAVLSIKASGVGLTLTAARRAVFCELQWTPGDIAQAQDRINRIGQRSKSVRYDYLVALDSQFHPNDCDNRMWKKIQRKHSVVTQAVEGRLQDAPDAAPAEAPLPADAPVPDADRLSSSRVTSCEVICYVGDATNNNAVPLEVVP